MAHTTIQIIQASEAIANHQHYPARPFLFLLKKAYLCVLLKVCNDHQMIFQLC